eukprot:TRINITY_DN81_c2_g1_i1.p1 TRINITY_DN81_c2_g1~~TRINITY_DN81_c2_g1_i1.p1  ORF type:complete len:345 (+),score=110.77 TRINITY_DN81_c2_g1_i1:60-1037(+)
MSSSSSTCGCGRALSPLEQGREEVNCSRELVVNVFVTERCNYHCAFCFSKWDPRVVAPETPLAEKKHMLDLLAQALLHNKDKDEIVPSVDYDRVRINFSGGEPLLYKDDCVALVEHARSLGFAVSITTNGLLLTNELIERLAPHLTKIGFSIDSLSASTNQNIGRCTGANTMSLADWQRCLNKLLSVNPNIKHKVNSVLGTYNLDEDFSGMLDALKPHKWTVVQLLPVFNKKLSISQAQLNQFVARHNSHKDVLICETNEDYRESFICISPDGRFFSNGKAVEVEEYQYSKRIVDVGVREAFSQIGFNHSSYIKRNNKCAKLTHY